MTIKEAIMLLNPKTTASALAEIEYYNGFSGKEACIEAIEDACRLAIEALEKQIPKKPEITAIGNLVKTRCNICGFTNSYVDWHTAQYKYCPSCGHAIDWSEEDD